MIAHLKELLKSESRKLSFAATGVTSAAPLDRAERAIRERTALGLLRDYGFGRRSAESFTRPGDILAEARSIVVVAMSYGSTCTESLTGTPRGSIARFAVGPDYHHEVEKRLKKLGELLQSEVSGSTYRVCVDTGPIIDRAVTQRAGVGSYGKNASIITREAGSRVVLGELITDVEIEPDEPAPLEDCGECDLCIRACPSGAIVRPFVIDQTRCISHLTQMRGAIPLEMRALIGDRIYGCDVCQEVCPKNMCTPANEPAPDSRPELIPLLDVSQEEFDRRFGPTAISWIGRSRLRRNVAVALGNIADPAAIPALRVALDDVDPLVSSHAQWALGRASGQIL